MAKAITVLAKIQLELAGEVAQIVPFAHHRARGFNYFLITEQGLRVRAQVATRVSEEQLVSLQSAPAERERSPFAKMQLLSDAGLLTCPCTGLPVFDATHAPPSLWQTLNDLAKAARVCVSEPPTHGAASLRGARMVESHLSS